MNTPRNTGSNDNVNNSAKLNPSSLNDNPLLSTGFNELPAFSKITHEHVEPAIDYKLQKNRARLQQLLENTQIYTWDNFVWPIEIQAGELGDLWAIISHLNAVKNYPEFSQAYQAALTKMSVFSAEIRHNEKLYQAFQSVANSPDFAKLTIPQKKIISNVLRNFKLSGINLSPDNRKQFNDLKIRQADLENQYEQNVLEATKEWSLHITDRERLNGFPVKNLNAAHNEAKEHRKTGWILTLDYPCYAAVMAHVEDPDIRFQMYKAYSTRASKNSNSAEKWDNGPVMIEILKIRHTLATLLGFNNYAEYELETHMLKKTSQVLDFLNDLLERSQKKAKEDMEELQKFAKTKLAIEEINPWDILFVSEQLQEQKYGVNEVTLRPYFPEDTVLDGLFIVANRLFGIKVKEIEEFDTWHENVRLFEVYDAKKRLRGKFYLDAFTRPDKHGGAWLSSTHQRMLLPDGRCQLPVANVVANLSKPSAAGIALLTHDEVITLFHEFGHCLHSILTTIDYPSISGGHGVEWDAIELPSQLLENWCWERETLDFISRHFKDNLPLPNELYIKLKAIKHYQMGRGLLRQLEFALLDFKLHMLPEPPKTETDIQNLLNSIREKTALLKPAPFNRYQNSFTHIFSGGYSAGYYSYLWSEVMSFDAYRLFKKRDLIFDEVVAKQFMSTILEQGGSKDFMELYVEFRGRPPQTYAMLKEFGLTLPSDRRTNPPTKKRRSGADRRSPLSKRRLSDRTERRNSKGRRRIDK